MLVVVLRKPGYVLHLLHPLLLLLHTTVIAAAPRLLYPLLLLHELLLAPRHLPCLPFLCRPPRILPLLIPLPH